MIIIILIVLVRAKLVGPQLWASAILKRYSFPRTDFPGNGEEFVRHLIDNLKLSFVSVESTETGDHYDPMASVVRLSSANMENRSLTAIVVAAHEVGHAIQHATNYRPFFWRIRLVVLAGYAEKMGSGLMLAIPIVGLISRSPVASGIVMLMGLMTMSMAVLVHIVTLPVEWNASFSRALPILEKGEYLSADDMKAAKKILLACALTYLAQSLMSLINLWRWIRVLKR
ncbi:MAG: zinc metallopeptidase [Gammaproteobacteria bacterium]|nr:zinc metallopeptidase [Gammaproteobacteria bacterium]